VSSYLHKRVLKFNVGFLLNDGPSHSQDITLDIPTVQVSEDLKIDYLRGPMRLTRTHEGILVQATLDVGVIDECYRCLDPVNRNITIDIEELYTHHSQAESEFEVGDDCILDLAPLLRAEVLIDASHRATCRDDCQGLCPGCGANRNYEACLCDQDNIDPRFEILKKLLNENG
jgi:uncharacterized protein